MKHPKDSRPKIIISSQDENSDKSIKSTGRPRGRPVKNDIMNLQGSIPATPEELARVILSTPPHKIKT